MNKIIKELVGDATLYADSHWDRGCAPWHQFYNEKFAELIVAECVKKCEFVAAMAEITNTGEMARKTKATADSCAQMIGQHFGVEE
jgi:hypothetical protein